MADAVSTTRRRNLKTLPAAGAAMAAPLASLALAPEHPWEKANRLAAELAAALSEIDGGDWFAEIHAASRERHPVLFTSRRAIEDIAAHAATTMGDAA